MRTRSIPIAMPSLWAWSMLAINLDIQHRLWMVYPRYTREPNLACHFSSFGQSWILSTGWFQAPKSNPTGVACELSAGCVFWWDHCLLWIWLTSNARGCRHFASGVSGITQGHLNPGKSGSLVSGAWVSNTTTSEGLQNTAAEMCSIEIMYVNLSGHFRWHQKARGCRTGNPVPVPG